MTTTIGIREMTRNTSKLVRRAGAGESFVVTEHERPVAMLVPLPETGDPAVDELIRDGTLTPATIPGGVAVLLALEPHSATGSETIANVIDSARAISDERDERL